MPAVLKQRRFGVMGILKMVTTCGTRQTIAPAGTKEVGGKLPNAFGLYDIHGNVREWCLDWYIEFPIYQLHRQRDPVGDVSGTNRIQPVVGF